MKTIDLMSAFSTPKKTRKHKKLAVSTPRKSISISLGEAAQAVVDGIPNKYPLTAVQTKAVNCIANRGRPCDTEAIGDACKLRGSKLSHLLARLISRGIIKRAVRQRGFFILNGGAQ